VGGLVLACAVLWVFAAVCFAVNLFAPVGPSVLLWLTLPLYGPLVAGVFWQASRTAEGPDTTRQFWRRMTPVPVLIGIAQSTQAVDVLRHPQPASVTNPPLLLAFDGAALVVVIYALLRLPSGDQGHGSRLRVLLDASTVVLATAVVIWHFGTRQAVATAAAGTTTVGIVALSLVLAILANLHVFALIRVTLAEHNVINRDALRLMASAMLIGALGPTAQPLLTAVDPRLYVFQLSIPTVFLLSAEAGRRQCRAVPRTRRVPAGRVRAFSLLPYTAVVAVDTLLLWVVCTDGEDVVVVASVAVGLMAVVVLRQVTALRDNGQLLGRLEHGATHDALTGLANRVLFKRRLQRALAPGGACAVSVVLVDLDDFKEVNDTLGHEVGDLLLVAVASRLSACVGADDTVARLGGDEFVMVLADSDPRAADRVADAMVDALRAPVVVDGHELAIRASIGIADGRSGDEASILLRQADIAMYAAKNVPGTAYLHYDADLGATGSDHANLVAELREAIETDQLFLLYQPIVSLDDGRLIGAEALVRWAHPTRGTLAPDVFLPAAERSGLTVPLGRWVLRNSVRQLAEWQAGRDAVPPMLNVNMSARDLREADLAAEVGALLRRYGVPASRLTLEVTETAALEGDQSLVTLHELRDLGVRIALDDFGTGYSTLALLQHCPVDEIKLDRAFTQSQSEGRVPMAAAVIHLAQVLGLHAVAEGVETEDQARALLALGYLAAQGYLFARPVPAADFAALFESEPARAIAG
jgi:diguanylate cyclase (GGDEF)-like protein